MMRSRWSGTPAGGGDLARREFTIADEYRYNRASAPRWIASHLLRHRRFLAGVILATLLANVLVSTVPAFIGAAFDEVLDPRLRAREAGVAEEGGEIAVTAAAAR